MFERRAIYKRLLSPGMFKTGNMTQLDPTDLHKEVGDLQPKYDFGIDLRLKSAFALIVKVSSRGLSKCGRVAVWVDVALVFMHFCRVLSGQTARIK